jgi:2-phosphosulfolactate phosphatase
VLDAAGGAPIVLTGAFVNATALAEELHKTGLEVVVVACGWEGKRALEDELAAGAILSRLDEAGLRLDERARRVSRAYLTRPNTDALKASAARRLMRLGQDADLSFCLSKDAVPVVPVLVDGAFTGRGAARRATDVVMQRGGS